jgi:hypothetical protein
MHAVIHDIDSRGTAMKFSVSNQDCLKVIDKNSHSSYYGCSQAWFASEWQRRAGCGPCVASNLVLYLTCGERAIHNTPICEKEACQTLMQKVWKYVTPTLRGIATTRLFCRRMFALADTLGFDFEHGVLDFPKNESKRPGRDETVAFFKTAFEKDVPVAFLNRCNGEETALSRWHWVTVLSVETTEPGGDLIATIADEGVVKTINFSLWQKTTKSGGGLVYFAPITKPSDQLMRAKPPA